MRKAIILGLTFAILLLNVFLQDCKGEGKSELQKFIQGYYLFPDPEKAEKHLKELLDSEDFKKNQDDAFYLYVNAYPFARIGSLEYSVLDKYAEILKSEDKSKSGFALKIFELGITDEEFEKIKEFLESDPNDFDTAILKQKFMDDSGKGWLATKILNENINDSGIIYFLWSEFFITGDERAIKNILSVHSEYYQPDVNELMLKGYELTKEQYRDIIRSTAVKSMVYYGKEDRNILNIYKEFYKNEMGVKKDALTKVIDAIDASISIPRLLEEAKVEKPVEGAKAWALAASAVLMERNRSRHKIGRAHV